VLTYAVGSATAAALKKRGFTDVRVGSAGVDAIVGQAALDGIRSLLHLAGEDHTRAEAGPVQIETLIVYASEPVEPQSDLQDAVNKAAVALLHSARAAARFRELAGPGHRIAAISPAVLAAAGPGWLETAIASKPTDQALLAAAARLCH
jgi:uroporphyrinogen-III synthase